MSRTRRLEELTLLNVIFCLLVVLIHVLSRSVASLDVTGWPYALVLIPQRLSFVSVYGFFFLSGVKLTLPRSRPQPLGEYYLGRAKHLLLPYLLAAALYYLCFVALGWYTFSIPQFLRETAMGTLSAQFYFLIALIQFILLTPLFRWLVQRYHPVFLLPLAAGLTWLAVFYLSAILQLFGPDVALPAGMPVFVSYLFYYLAGCCAGQHYARFLSLLEENRSLLTAAALFFAAADGIISLLAFSGRRSAPYLEYIHTLYMMSAIPALFGWAVRHRSTLQNTSAWPVRLLHAIDRASYLIYLYHCIIITLFNAIAPRLVGSRVSILLPLSLLVVYPVSIGGCILWQRLWAAAKGFVNHPNQQP